MIPDIPKDGTNNIFHLNSRGFIVTGKLHKRIEHKPGPKDIPYIKFDGCYYRVVGVEAFAHGGYFKKGEPVGYLIEGPVTEVEALERSE